VNNTFLNDTQLTGTGGNADLSPYESWNFNLSAEYYFAEQSLVAWSIFYKKIDNYIDSSATIERQYNSIRDTSPAAWALLVGSNGSTADGYCDYSVSRPHNGGGANIKGMTFTYQQPFGDTGFGLAANYTYASGKADAGNAMPYLSRHTVSLSPYYEKGAFSARVNYSFRSHYLGAGYVAGAVPATTDDYGDLSASLGWNFNDHYSVSLDAMNLTNQKYFQYQGTDAFPVAMYSTGRRYMANLHLKF